MANETTQPQKGNIDYNTQPPKDTTIPLTSNTLENKNKNKTPLQNDSSSLTYNILPRNNTQLLSESVESSEDEEYVTPSKEPYENKYIKLTTIDALDFLSTTDEFDTTYSDAILNIIHKSTNLALLFCLVSSALAAFISRSGNNLGFWFLYLSWTKFYFSCTLFWIYHLHRLNSASLSLKDAINIAKKVAMGISISQFIYQLLTNNVEVDKNPLIYASSAISFPFFVLFEEILYAYQKENKIKQALLKEERANSQKSVYKAIDRFSERKGLYLRTISDQLRQTTDLATDTLKQLTPLHFLSKPHEQLSACSISFPTSSINAIHNILKDINYISTHLGTLSLLLFSEQVSQGISQMRREFDIGEIIQQVGDVLAGDACNAKVELVIYHVEYGLNHLNVIGDEAAFRHSLLDLLKCIIDGANPGDCIELGLQIRLSSEPDSHGSRTINPHDKVTCTIKITHHPGGNTGSKESKRNNMFPNANLTHKILSFLGAELKVGEGLEIIVELEAGSPLAPPNVPNVNEESLRRYPHLRITGEPSIGELIKTSQNMKGQRVALHATSKSHFAQHITSCLTTWSTDISHVPIGGEEEFETPRSETPSPLENEINDSDVTLEERKNSDLPPNFIIVDDDIDTLKQQLTQLKKVPFQLNAMSTVAKRQVQAPNLSSRTTAVIHFTSLANYKPVKDAVQYIISSATSPFNLPQVLVIPKPAGPRRFLAALHTTINRIVVDPVYMPIATSPMSPGQQFTNGIDLNANPMENVISDSGITESPGNYFPPDARPDTSSPMSKPSTPNIPLSPRPGGGVIVVPKNVSRSSDKNVIIKVGSPGKNVPFQNTGPLSPGVNKSPSNGGSPNSGCSPQQVQPSTPSSTSIQNQPSPQPRKKPKKKPITDNVIPPVNVLIVEDNPINQAILSTFMKKKMIKYECASNGQEAVEKWQKGGFHLVLMDIQLPVMDGIEATKKIRSLEKSQKIGVFPSTPSSASQTPIYETPVNQTPPSTPDLGLIPVIIVALTASSLPSDRTNALAAGCNDFLTKPVSLVWLERKIQEWGCMQALIDFDGWKRWKRDGEEALKEKRTEMTTIIGPGGNKSKAVNFGGSVKLSKSVKLKQRQNSQAEENNLTSENTTVTSRSILVTEVFPSNSLDSTKDKKMNTLPSTTPTLPNGNSPAGTVTPPPIVIKPSTPQSNNSPKICPIFTNNNMKNNLINNNNSLTITTDTSTPPMANTTNESSSQPSTPLSTSDPQKTVRKRGNTVSLTNGVNMNVDQNGNSLM
ncbi:hypothetical protein RclHR1_00150060 [Rhizophagus clarus]|uniref:Osomolarity two-component system, response regulator SSK1 n=1 Tax=Rhizophagus clarus TaxID=94130 RepID=A0A2Z6QTD1_9GLOM|nr:hypothetical protein RclHR1_00150060 [Rhizophagus clarus]GES84771.1 osomolarity two-component system, response regulator SSK1 [Rhizophagus clarus]